VAVALSVAASVWCEFVKFELPGGANPYMGPWRYQSFVTVIDGGNIYQVEKCKPYPDGIKLDSLWKMSRAATVIAPILGTVALLPTFFRKSPCMGGVFLLLASLFQGLTMLLLDSDLCMVSKSPIFQAFPLLSLFIDDCTMASGAIISVVAAALFFLAAIPAFLVK
jgi:hypothetical protein